jgi:hypothetical protein
MAPDEESKPEISQSDAPGSPPGPRRDRRPSRGRRGRGRGRRPKPAPGQAAPEAEGIARSESGLPPADQEPIFELAQEPGADPVPDRSEAHHSEPIAESVASPGPSAPSRPASPASVEQAIEEVGGIVDTLRSALNEMEEVLEMLEMFERQKNADEREIDSLRRALRQVHRPREGGHHQQR